jgi:hypothetical protein
VAVVARVSYRYSARRAEPVDAASDEFRRARNKLIAELSLSVQGLKSVAATAPYLGLVGTCVGILGMFHAIVMSKSAALAMEASELGAAPLSTAAGLLVAMTATCFYNFLRTRIELLKLEVSSKLGKCGARGFRVAQTLPLAPRLYKLPFAAIAVPVLALSIAGYMTLASFRIARGLRVGIAPNPCASQFYERVIVLHVTGSGKVLINTEEESWNKLAYRLSQIYSARVDRTLYLLADDDVPFQMVADAIDTVNSAPFAGTSDRLGIRVELITPAALSANCPEVWRVPPIYPRQS